MFAKADAAQSARRTSCRWRRLMGSGPSMPERFITWANLQVAKHDGERGQDMNTSFSKDIRDLFRQRDRDAMLNTRHGFDLWDHGQVSSWADRILAQLEGGSMPCDRAWPPENVAIFKQWITGGKLP